MKILSKSEGYLSNIERYDLNETFSQTKMNYGLIICYTLTAFEDIKFVSLEVKARHEEIGVPLEWHEMYDESSFEEKFYSIEKFVGYYNVEEFGRWRMKVIYQNNEIAISGEKDDTEIAVSYDKKLQINLLPLLSSAETKTYQYNNYDINCLNVLKNEFRMTDKRAVLSLQKLQTHMDIYEEFVRVIISGQIDRSESAICVEGFTAEKLHKNYPLSILGAYNYLIYLREYPKEAVSDLKKGLPRK